MNPVKNHTAFAVFFSALTLGLCLPAHAGLDLKNQTEVAIDDLDLDHNGRITRKEVAEYMFYYFDRDGNEVLTSGEYRATRPIAVKPSDGTLVTFTDLDNDGQDDGIKYDTESFLKKAMVSEYDPGGKGIRAQDFVDLYLMRIDSDKSDGVELSEWQKAYEKHAVNKPNTPTEANNNDRYNPN